MVKKIFKYFLGVLSIVADSIAIITYFSFKPENLPTILSIDFIKVLWTLSFISFIMVIIIYLDEMPHKLGISISFFIYLYYHIIIKRDNKVFLFWLIIMLITLGLIGEYDALGVFAVIFIFPTFVIGSTFFFDFDGELSKIIDSNWYDITKFIREDLLNRKYIYINDLQGINTKYNIPKLFNFSILKKFSAQFSKDYDYGFLINSSGKRSPVRLLINLKMLNKNEKVVR